MTRWILGVGLFILSALPVLGQARWVARASSLPDRGGEIEQLGDIVLGGLDGRVGSSIIVSFSQGIELVQPETIRVISPQGSAYLPSLSRISTGSDGTLAFLVLDMSQADGLEARSMIFGLSGIRVRQAGKREVRVSFSTPPWEYDVSRNNVFLADSQGLLVLENLATRAVRSPLDR